MLVFVLVFFLNGQYVATAAVVPDPETCKTVAAKVYEEVERTDPEKAQKLSFKCVATKAATVKEQSDD